MARTPLGVNVVFFPPWSKRPFGFRSPAPWQGNAAALSVPQLKACVALAEAASGAFGTRGKAVYKGRSMPAICLKVAAVVPSGPGVHGGIPPVERARMRHELAGKSISALRSLIAAKGG